MYKIPANTLFTGKNLVYVPQCHSTNTLAADLSQKTGVPEGTVVITNNQTAGKGQRGNTWEAEAGKNLTFSVLLKPFFLSAREQFYLTVITSLAVRDSVAMHLGEEVKIKWPNDIQVNGKKIAGILIENNLSGDRVSQSILGIGLNVNQTTFTTPTATSLSAISDEDYDTNTILSSVLENLEGYYLRLRKGDASALRNAYYEHLYWLNEKHLFEVGGKEVSGIITGVDTTGYI